MRKLTIPAILAAAVLVAGVFAFMPVEQASTVHTTIQGTQNQIQVAEDTNNRIAAADSDILRVVVKAEDSSNNDVPFILQQLIVCGDTANDAAGDIQAKLVTIDGDSIEGTDGAALTVADVADGSDVQSCTDVIAGLSGNNAGEVPTVWASNGADILVDFDAAKGTGTLATSDTITSVKAVGIVDGDGTLSVVSSVQ